MLWKLLPKKSDDLLEQLLLNRGLKAEKEKEFFLNPQIKIYQSDLQIPGIPKAQNRIKKAIDTQELIIIYGDYDVDGICAAAILYQGLASLGAKVLPYIPHREKEGYGMSQTGLDFARESGAAVVISVDNGIVAFEPAKYAKQLGLDLIITDHHLPKDERPEAFAIVHSLKMCGAAVAWCLIEEMVEPKLARNLLQFVAMATIADMIPLLDLGRAFVKEGLEVLNKTDNPGLLALITEAGLEKGKISTWEIGFAIGPRLNAIGRLEHAIDGLRLLCTKDHSKAKKLARLLTETNSKRRDLTDEAVEEAHLKVKSIKKKKIFVLDSVNWQSGIIGLIAGRICENYARPTIAISVGETLSKGSARSIDGVNIVEMIRQCSDLLIDVGGHKGAAGFSIMNENIGQFKKRLEELAEKLEEGEKFLEIEAEVESKKLTKKLVSQMESFEPFGFGNPRPTLATYQMVLSDIRTVGSGKHLKFKADGLEAIAFGLGSLTEVIKNNQQVDIAYQLEINKFNGSETLQLKVKDINYG